MQFLNIAYITRVNIGSLNGGEGMGGNITPIKKISDYQGNEYAYISGQALRRYIKETLLQLGERISGVNDRGEPNFLELNDKIYTKDEKNFQDIKLLYNSFCDLDLFGYMLPNGDRRWSPVKVSPLASILPYKGEHDYLTRKQQTTATGERRGNIVQVEIDTLNFMRGNIMVDVGKIGKEVNEYTYELTEMLGREKADARRNALIEAIKNLNGGARQARNLEDIAPKFVIAVKQKTGNPFLLNTLSVNTENKLILHPIFEALNDHQGIFCENGVSVGLAANTFANEEEIKTEFAKLGYSVLTVTQALDSLKAGVR